MRKFLFLVPLFALACNPGLKKPGLAVESARVARVEFDQVLVELQVVITNPNRIPLPADRVRYEGFLEGKRVAHGQLQRNLIVPASGQETVKLPVVMRYSELGDAVRTLREKENWSWEIKGEVGIDIKDQLVVALPFAKSGELAAPALPKVRISRAAIDSVSATELVAVVDVEIENPNAFAIPEGELEARLRVGEILLDAVRARMPRIAANKTRVIKLRQKTSLVSLGALALKVATGQPLDARVVGELRAGEHALPIDLAVSLKK